MINFFRLSSFFFYLLLFASCSVYENQFDCPSRKGIPCASVTDIESMIIETEKGADFIDSTKYPLQKVWVFSQESDHQKTLGYYMREKNEN